MQVATNRRVATARTTHLHGKTGGSACPSAFGAARIQHQPDATGGELMQSTIVLHVEDDADGGEAVTLLLRSATYTGDGPHRESRSALAAIQARTPHVALLDFQLLDGTSEPIAETLTRLAVPFVILTGLARNEVPDSIRPTAILQKPFGVDQLLRLLRDITGK